MTNLQKQAREYFLQGGGGFEDGEAGARACTFSFEGMVEMAAAFAEFALEGERADVAEYMAGEDI